MNLMDILLLEAIKINNGREAYELIKNNKLGVKIHPFYREADEDIIPYLNRVISDVGPNDAVFAIQLLVNKVPMDKFREVSNSDTLKEIVSCRNKPWAKNIPGYKEAIDFNSKEAFSYEKWHDLEKKLQEEGQKHGKKNKGGGDTNEVINAYDDGTWALQMPKSWDGAKAASFYGKIGEKQIPTEWCTRANEKYYNMYTEDNTKPLYIIRNWKTGKAYQMAIRGNRVDFLDQNDVRGDEITKGDFTNIPDELLKKIPYGNGETMLDFKNEFKKANKELAEYKKSTKKALKSLPLTKGSSFIDPTENIKKARWGKIIKVNNKVSKQVWENFAKTLEDPKVDNPLSNAKGFNSAILPKTIKQEANNGSGWKSKYITGNKKSVEYKKHDGQYAVKYFFTNNPKMAVIISATRSTYDFVKDQNLPYPTNNKDRLYHDTSFNTKYYISNEKTGNLKNVSKGVFLKNKDSEELIEIASKDSGIYKTEERWKNRRDRGGDKYQERINNLLTKYVNKELTPIVQKKFNDNNIKATNVSAKFLEHFGTVLPNGFEIYFENKDKNFFLLVRPEKSNGYKYKSIFTNRENEKEVQEVKKELMDKLNSTIKNFIKEAMSDPYGKMTRQRLRTYGGNEYRENNDPMKKWLYEEVNYFPY